LRVEGRRDGLRYYLANRQERQRCQPASFRRGERISTEGEPGDNWYGLLSGWVRVTHQTPSGPVLLGKLGPGRFFGELALIESGRRAASVEAESDCICAVLSRVDFLALLDEAPVAGQRVRDVIASYNRQPPPVVPA